MEQACPHHGQARRARLHYAEREDPGGRHPRPRCTTTIMPPRGTPACPHTAARTAFSRHPAHIGITRSSNPQARTITTSSTRTFPDRLTNVSLRWLPQARIGVFAVSAAGVLYAFPAWWTHYLNSVSAEGLAQIPLSLLLLELSGYCVNAVRLHVNAAEVLVRRGIDRYGSR